MPLLIYTVGHSTRSAAEFLALIREFGIEHIVDVRKVPRSRHNPQFDISALPRWLQEAGITYEHMSALGGFRHPSPDSVNRGWRHDAFRGYADYMQTPEFHLALDHVLDQARRSTTAIMCAEAVPWRCHRSLIGDALVVRGADVVDIIGPGSVRPHRLPAFAKVEGERLTYPGQASHLFRALEDRANAAVAVVVQDPYVARRILHLTVALVTNAST